MARYKERRLRCNVRKFLNRPGHHGNASVIAYVERGRNDKRWPWTFFQVSDCDSSIILDFSGYAKEDRENNICKIDALYDAVGKFRTALHAENERLKKYLGED